MVEASTKLRACGLWARAPSGAERVFGEPTHQGEVVTVDLVAGAKPGDAGADDLHPPRDVRAECLPPRSPQTSETGIEGCSPQPLPIGQVDRCRHHFDQHLTRARYRRRYLFDPQYVGTAVSVVNDCPHAKPRAELRAARAVRLLATAIPSGYSVDRRVLSWPPLCGEAQPTADLMSAVSFFSTAGVHSTMANTTGHIGPSSRAAASSNPNIAYRPSNFDAALKKQISLPSGLV